MSLDKYECHELEVANGGPSRDIDFTDFEAEMATPIHIAPEVVKPTFTDKLSSVYRGLGQSAFALGRTKAMAIAEARNDAIDANLKEINRLESLIADNGDEIVPHDSIDSKESKELLKSIVLHRARQNHGIKTAG